MLKLTIAILAMAPAGSAGAAGWRSMRVDGTSEASFTESVAALRKVDSRPNQRPLNSFNTTSPWPTPPPPQGRTGEQERGRTGMAGF